MNGRTNTSGIVINNGIMISLEPVTSLTLTSQDSKAIITWTDPEDKVASPGGEDVGHWVSSVLVRNTDHIPTSPSDGVRVVVSTVRNQYSGSGYEDTGLQNETKYYYSVFAYNHIGMVSDPTSGEVTPEEIFSLIYDRVLNAGLSTSSGNYCMESTIDSAILCANYDRDNHSLNKGKQFDSSLVAHTFTPSHAVGEYHIGSNGKGYTSVSFRIGNAAIFRGESVEIDSGSFNTYYTYRDVLFSVNSDLVQSDIDSWLQFGTEEHSDDVPLEAHETIWSACDANGVCGYIGVVAYTNISLPWQMRRYDSNKLSSNVAGFAYNQWYSSTTWLSAYVSTLSTTSDAIFSPMNFYTWSSSNHTGNYINNSTAYRYSQDGVQSQLNFQDCKGNVSMTRCNDGFMIAGGIASGDRSEMKAVYGFSADYVSTKLSDLEGYEYGEYDIQSNGLGIIITGTQEGDRNSRCSAEVYNKHFVKQTAVSFTANDPSTKACRVGDYILIRNSTYSQQITTFKN